MARRKEGDREARRSGPGGPRRRRAAWIGRRLALLLSGFFAAACAPDRRAPSGSDPALDSAAEPDPEVREIIHSAARCGECHASIAAEWQSSAHAMASRSAPYLAMRKDPLARDCDRCHAPFADKLAPGAQAAREGVTCELCHGIKQVTREADGFRNVVSTRENVKYGPTCNTQRPYFHKVGCSPVHAESLVCAGCHEYSRALPTGEKLPVFTEHSEWEKSPQRGAGKQCQDCHMPEDTVAYAIGSAARSTLSHHGWLGIDGSLRRQAMAMSITVSDAAPKLKVELSLTNIGAAHSVPTGLPGRQLVTRARVLDGSGRTIDTVESTYARVLVDEQGREVPFYAAKRVAADTRIEPGSRRRVELTLAAPAEEGEARVELVWRAMSPALTDSLGLPAAAEISLLQGRVSFGKLRAGAGRASLPKTVDATP